MNSSSERPKRIVSLLLAITNLIVGVLGLVAISAIWPARPMIVGPLSDTPHSLFLLYVFWSINCLLLIALIVGGILLLRLRPVGIRICSWTYLFQIAWWSSNLMFLKYPFFFARTDNTRWITSVIACISAGNAGVPPQQALFFPFASLSILVILFGLQAAFLGPLSLKRPVAGSAPI